MEESTPKADYPIRTCVTKERFANALSSEVENIDYDNFKNSIDDEEYHDACLKVWGVMRNYENRLTGR